LARRLENNGLASRCFLCWSSIVSVDMKATKMMSRKGADIALWKGKDRETTHFILNGATRPEVSAQSSEEPFTERIPYF
jgi:hypothetical protein